MTDVRTALVIGGGIAGPVAAMALRRAGIEATVYEAYDSRADGVGGMLGIAANGINALGVVGLDEAVRGIGVPMSSMVLESWTGKRLAEFGTLPGLPPSQAVWRGDLYRILYGGAAQQGIRIEHGKKLVRAQDTGDGVVAHFADGSQATADILIGADGIRSTVRQTIDPAGPRPRYTGLLGFGGRPAPGGDAGLAPTKGTMHMIFGRQAFFAYQVYEDAQVSWFANLPHPEPMTLAETTAVGAREWLRVLRETFAADRTPAPELLRRTDPEQLLMVGALEDLPTVPNWSRGRMVLVGDAAHATSPSSGQGASLAAESAIELARCLRDLPLSEAFAQYEQVRRPRVERIIAAAARTNSNKAAGPVGRVLRDTLMPLAARFAKPERMAWQFGYRIDWDAPAGSAKVAGLSGA